MNILLVDDDADCLERLVSVLEPVGHRCEMFTVPERALEAYQQKQYDLIITDMKMPGLSGTDVLKKARSINPEARVIIVTGYGDVETTVTLLNNGACAFFDKPVEMEGLMLTLEKIEHELSRQKEAKIEHAHLAMEYACLKQAYEDLLKLYRSLAAFNNYFLD